MASTIPYINNDGIRVTNRLTILTISFSGDFELCKLLCETVDRFVSTDVQHVIAVPRSDFPLFAPLCRKTRTLVSQEQFLPSWLKKVPLPPPEWRKRLFLPRRNVYYAFPRHFVRGWIAQQIIKLGCAASIISDGVLHVDSDAVFVSPLSMDQLFSQNKLRLTKFPGLVDVLPDQQGWHAEAKALLGIDGNVAMPRHGYIQAAVAWSPENVRKLLNHIQSTTGRKWQDALARSNDFSEYILYGLFCDQILGENKANHYTSSDSLSHTVWHDDGSELLRDIEKFVQHLRLTIGDDQPVVTIQSTIPVGMEFRRGVTEAFLSANEDGTSRPAHRNS